MCIVRGNEPTRQQQQQIILLTTTNSQPITAYNIINQKQQANNPPTHTQGNNYSMSCWPQCHGKSCPAAPLIAIPENTFAEKNIAQSV